MLWTRLRKRIVALVRRSKVESEMADELQFHLDARASDLMRRQSVSPEEARRRARLNSVPQRSTRKKAGRRGVFAGSMNPKQAARSGRRSPSFPSVTSATTVRRFPMSLPFLLPASSS